MDDLIYLIAETFEPDDLAQMIPTETSRAVWASIQSVKRAEWMDAGQKGLQPQLVAVTPFVNYEGEEIVQIGEGDKAKRYGIYRTFLQSGNDMIELYLERKAGV